MGSEPFLEFDVICCLPCCKNALQFSLVAWALALNTAAAAAAADAFDDNDDDDEDDAAYCRNVRVCGAPRRES